MVALWLLHAVLLVSPAVSVDTSDTKYSHNQAGAVRETRTGGRLDADLAPRIARSAEGEAGHEELAGRGSREGRTGAVGPPTGDVGEKLVSSLLNDISLREVPGAVGGNAETVCSGDTTKPGSEVGRVVGRMLGAAAGGPIGAAVGERIGKALGSAIQESLQRKARSVHVIEEVARRVGGGLAEVGKRVGIPGSGNTEVQAGGAGSVMGGSRGRATADESSGGGAFGDIGKRISGALGGIGGSRSTDGSASGSAGDFGKRVGGALGASGGLGDIGKRISGALGGIGGTRSTDGFAAGSAGDLGKRVRGMLGSATGGSPGGIGEVGKKIGGMLGIGGDVSTGSGSASRGSGSGVFTGTSGSFGASSFPTGGRRGSYDEGGREGSGGGMVGGDFSFSPGNRRHQLPSSTDTSSNSGVSGVGEVLGAAASAVGSVIQAGATMLGAATGGASSGGQQLGVRGSRVGGAVPSEMPRRHGHDNRKEFGRGEFGGDVEGSDYDTGGAGKGEGFGRGMGRRGDFGKGEGNMAGRGVFEGGMERRGDARGGMERRGDFGIDRAGSDHFGGGMGRGDFRGGMEGRGGMESRGDLGIDRARSDHFGGGMGRGDFRGGMEGRGGMESRGDARRDIGGSDQFEGGMRRIDFRGGMEGRGKLGQGVEGEREVGTRLQGRVELGKKGSSERTPRRRIRGGVVGKEERSENVQSAAEFKEKIASHLGTPGDIIGEGEYRGLKSGIIDMLRRLRGKLTGQNVETSGGYTSMLLMDRINSPHDQLGKKRYERSFVEFKHKGPTEDGVSMPNDAEMESRVIDDEKNVLDLKEPAGADSKGIAKNLTGAGKANQHVHDGKAGCYGWRRRMPPPVDNSDSDSEDAMSEMLRQLPARMRRMRGRRDTASLSRGVRESERDDDNSLDDVDPETRTSILDFSIKDLVKRCVESVLGANTVRGGGSSSGGVAVARDGIAAGRVAIQGGIQVAKMVVQALRELGAPSSLVTNIEPSSAILSVPEISSRSRRDTMTNVKKNIKNKADVIVSRTNDVTENVNDRMDSVFGENKVYQKVKEVVMDAVGKAMQAAIKVGGQVSRRRRSPEGPTDARPRKGKEAILARILADLDNMPGRRIAKMATPHKEGEVSEDLDDEQVVGAEGAQGEAADMLKRTRRATNLTKETEDTDTSTARADESSEEAAEPAAASTQEGPRTIGAELGLERKRRDAADAMAGFRNMTEQLMQRGREVFAKVKLAIEEALKKNAMGASGPGPGGDKAEKKTEDAASEAASAMPDLPPDIDIPKLTNMIFEKFKGEEGPPASGQPNLNAQVGGEGSLEEHAAHAAHAVMRRFAPLPTAEHFSVVRYIMKNFHSDSDQARSKLNHG